ncbi:MAG TPA: phosphoribosyltransferase family protein, partial [Xanthomonadaceae bacterium]|nr:phosphoribosyltransferase family protein [Xanthomonadaceae bacterium]
MSESRFCLYDARELDAVLDRMARQATLIIGDRPATLVGVLRRGAPLADMLAERIQRLAPRAQVARTDLKVKRYGDDLTLLHAETSLNPSPEQVEADFTGRAVIVVDDVLYLGHSVLRVVEFLRSRHPESIHVAVLVDRCCTRLPVVAEIAGLRMQIAPDDVIECNVP